MSKRPFRRRTSLSCVPGLLTVLFEEDRETTFLGKKIRLADDAGVASHLDLERFLATFNLTWTLRRLGELRALIGASGIRTIGSTQVPAYCIPYLALVAIEVGNDDIPTVPSFEDLAEAARIMVSLEGNELPGTVFDLLLRMGYQQFTQHDRMHAIGRTWFLYEKLWDEVEAAKGLEVRAAVEKLFGISLGQLFLFCFLYTTPSERGYVSPIFENAPPELDILGLSTEQEAMVLNRLSASYSMIRALATKLEVPEDFKHYRPNPLRRWPLVRPDVSPEGSTAAIFLTPSSDLLLVRLTESLFYDLTDYFDKGTKNLPFRTALGHVFQAYVGRLLTESHGSARIRPEFKYGKKSAPRDTPDWLVVEGDHLVVIEAKLRGLAMHAKITGAEEATAKDLEETLAYGCHQLLRFADDLYARAPGLEALGETTQIELLLIAYDRLPFANYVLRQRIRDLGVQGADKVHICSIAEFELLQKHCWGDGMYDLLRAKRLSDTHRDQDFIDWLASRTPMKDEHPLLAREYEDLANSWNVPALRKPGNQ